MGGTLVDLKSVSAVKVRRQRLGSVRVSGNQLSDLIGTGFTGFQSEPIDRCSVTCEIGGGF